MRSKIFQKILDNTPKSVEDKVVGYYGLFPNDKTNSFPDCIHNYIVRDQYWSSCELCGNIKPNMES